MVKYTGENERKLTKRTKTDKYKRKLTNTNTWRDTLTKMYT